jgi:hypothetical protein
VPRDRRRGKPPEPRPPVLRPRAIIDVLEKHEVQYVIIGGIGARLWGSPRNTDDLDICPAATRANKQRLAGALTELAAHFRPPGLEDEGFDPPGGWDEGSFNSIGVSLAVTTDLGWMDIWFVPDGTQGYDDLIKAASDAPIGGRNVKVADIKDIIRSKAATGRNKDLAALDHLRELERRRDELGRDAP